MEINSKMIGYILFAIGIIGGVEGASGVRGEGAGFIISIIAMVFIIIASYFIAKE